MKIITSQYIEGNIEIVTKMETLLDKSLTNVPSEHIYRNKRL